MAPRRKVHQPQPNVQYARIGQRLVQMPIPAGFPRQLFDNPPSHDAVVFPGPVGGPANALFSDPIWSPFLTPLPVPLVQTPDKKTCQTLEHWALLIAVDQGGEAFEKVIWKPDKLNIGGIVAQGDTLDPDTIAAINAAAAKAPAKFRFYVAYENTVKVGGALAWRQNNPGNLRSSPRQLTTYHGFAVFESMDAGRQAQRDLYLNKYGTQKVRDAIPKLTPPEDNNDTDAYLHDLEAQGVDLDKDMKSQIDVIMPAVYRNEGLIEGSEIGRCE